MARSPSRSRPEPGSDQGPPKQFPQTTPQQYAQPGHDFTLQAVMEMQRSLGEMGAKIERLITDSKAHGDDIGGISRKINLFLGGAAVVGAIFGVLVTVGAFNWDRIFPPRSAPQETVAPAALPGPLPP